MVLTVHKKAESPHLLWPTDAHSAVWRADRFLHIDQDFKGGYLAETHALHVYDYAGRMRLGDREFSLEPGVLTLSPAGEFSSYHLPQCGYHWCIHFRPVARTGVSAQLPLYMALGQERRSVVARFTEVARLHALSFSAGAGGRLAKAAASAALQQLLLHIAMLNTDGRQHTVEAAATTAIDRVLELINERLDASLRMPDLAREVNLSQNYLARCFRNQFGVTIPRYILRRRIDLASQLLRTTDLQVKAIAARVGMPDAQHFNKQFRRLAGLSPTAYRNAKRHENPKWNL